MYSSSESEGSTPVFAILEHDIRSVSGNVVDVENVINRNETFLSLQAVASFISKSLALMGDSSTMVLDSITYAMNYWLEIQKEKKTRSKLRLQWIEIYVSGLSVIVLLGVSIVFLILAIQRIVNAKNSEQEVEATFVLVFSAINLVFDFLSLGLFIHERRSLVDQNNDMNVNFFSAFLHIVADFLRTVSELVASLLVIAFDTDSELTDAYCAIVVEFFILAPALYVMFELISRIRSLQSSSVIDSNNNNIVVDSSSDIRDNPLVLRR
jgi:Co/Zn/Cd efflux system component